MLKSLLRTQASRTAIGYGLVPLLVVLTTLLLQLPDTTAIDPSVIGVLYLVPVLICAAVVGWAGGMIASVLSFLAFNYFFLSPTHSFSVTDPSDTLALVVFLVVAGLISYLVGRMRLETIRARQRERELTILYELSKTISGQIGLESMLETIAQRVCQSFADSHCEIWLKQETGKLALAAQAGAGANGHGAPREALIRSGQSSLGILKLYRPPAQPHTPAEQLLLNAIATQAALAIERSQLVQAATRAKVLEESDRLKSALLSSVSHDLRTPLATIKAAVTSLMQRDVQWDEEALVDQLSAINEESDRLNQVIGNLLSMSRIESGAIELRKRPYVLPEVSGAVLHRLATRTHSHPVRIDMPADLPLVPLDYAAFEQILSNLLDNAMKYSPAGAPITLSARRVGDLVEVAVRDEGAGIPADAQQSVFDKFYRVPNGTYVPGSGLGLSIVKGFVEAHGGKAWIISHPGKGTSVHFTLPLQAVTTSV